MPSGYYDGKFYDRSSSGFKAHMQDFVSLIKAELKRTKSSPQTYLPRDVSHCARELAGRDDFRALERSNMEFSNAWSKMESGLRAWDDYGVDGDMAADKRERADELAAVFKRATR